MSMFPYVKKGDPFVPDAKFDNECRKLVNHLADKGVAKYKTSAFEQTKIPCYNSGSAVLKAGTTVCLADDNLSISQSILPIQICDDKNKDWGILDVSLPPGEIGTFTVLGIVKIEFDGNDDFVEPDQSGGFHGCNSGSAKVLYKFNDGNALILLGAGSGSARSYTGPFAFSKDENGDLKIASGTLNRNGKCIDIPDTVFKLSEIKSGTLSVVCKFNTDSNTWEDAKIEFSAAGVTSYPIGKCKKIDADAEKGIKESFSYECYEVPMAFILYTKECPLAAKNNS